MISIATALICSAKARHSDDLKSFEKQSEGLARQSTAKEMQSTDQIGKGSALFRNDTKRHGNDMLATEKLSTEKRWWRQAYSGGETSGNGNTLLRTQ